MSRRSVAVVGSGVSGLTAAYLLSSQDNVTLYEADPRLGGHAHTHDVTAPDGEELAVDTGFIVHNDRTYPHLRRLFAELGVQVRRTEMSMSIRDERTGMEYAGGRGPRGVLAQPANLLDPRFRSVLRQVPLFGRRARRFLARTGDTDQTTYAEFLRQEGFDADFTRLYAVPVVASVWSMGTGAALDYPARYLFRFLDHHGLLTLTGSPGWYTVLGGSRQYVEKLAGRLPDVRRGRSVTRLLRTPDGTLLRDASGEEREYDAVVVATHADQALDLLADPSPEEKEVLGAFRYSRTEAVLHTDASLLPATRGARSSWNYLTTSEPCVDRPPVVTYWMNRLQGLPGPEQYLVTLNARARIDPERVIEVLDYTHPIYDLAAVRAQRRLPEIFTSRTVYAGAYHGWGFHEDGCRSGVVAAQALGVTW
jgi:predicted NAD/FAD-binding protein